MLKKTLAALAMAVTAAGMGFAEHGIGEDLGLMLAAQAFLGSSFSDVSSSEVGGGKAWLFAPLYDSHDHLGVGLIGGAGITHARDKCNFDVELGPGLWLQEAPGERSNILLGLSAFYRNVLPKGGPPEEGQGHWGLRLSPTYIYRVMREVSVNLAVPVEYTLADEKHHFAGWNIIVAAGIGTHF